MKAIKIFIAVVLTLFISRLPALGQEKQSAAEILEVVILDSGILSGQQKFKDMNASESGKYNFDEQEFNELAFKLQLDGKVETALEIYKMNTELFPRSGQAWSRLAKCHVLLVDRDKAAENYEKALAVDPNNSSAREELGWMEPRIQDAKFETKIPRKFEPGVQTGLAGIYLGQKPPGLTPEKFAPGIVSTYGAREIGCTFSPDGKAFYFKRPGIGVMVSHWREGGWTAPEKTDIDGGEMYIWPKDGHMYLNVMVQAPEGSEQNTQYGIGVLEKSGTEWGKPQFLVPGMFVTLSKTGTIYTSWFFEGDFDVIKYTPIDGVYSTHEVLGPAVNSAVFDAHPCVAPDESFLIFDSTRKGSFAFSDLYISFRDKNGQWTEAVNMGEEVNMPGINQCPMLSPDGKILFWNSHNDIYWVDAKIIEILKQEEL
jgi:hypothetical protein